MLSLISNYYIMKKIISYFIFIAILLWSIFWFNSAFGFNAWAWDDITISEELSWDSYFAWARVEVLSGIDGDLTLAWGEVNVEWNVSEDLMIAGGNITVSWDVGDDVRIVWGAVIIENNIDGDLVIAAGDIRIKKDVVIGGNLVVWAWRLILDWVVEGNFKGTIGELRLSWMVEWNSDIYIDTFRNPANLWKLQWNVTYHSYNQIPELEDTVWSEVTFEKTFLKEKVKDTSKKFLSGYIVMSILFIFILSSLLYFLFEKIYLRSWEILYNTPWKSFLYWFLTILLTPFIIVLLFITIIGIPVWLFFLFAYIFIFVFLWVINTIVLTALFWYKQKNLGTWGKIGIIFIFSVIFWIINGIDLIVWFFTLWALFINKKEMLQILTK